MKVAQLIDHELHTWKNSLVRDMFSPISTQAILSIPIPYWPKPDKLLWIPNSRGLFSVKFAYKELLPTPPPQASFNVNWSKLWKFKGPERIKIFLWRVAVNALPTRENLMSRMDIPNSTCVLCNLELESAPHLFLKCPIARAIWFATCWGFKSDQLGSTIDIIKCILEPPSDICQVQDLWLISLNMAFTLEEIWHTRNVVLHLRGPINLQASIDIIGARLRECTLIFSHFDVRLSAESYVRWPPPPKGTIKLNVDAAISLSNTALAVVARNEHGAVLKVWAKIMPKSSPLVAETEVILWALQLAKEEHWNNILVESDSKNSINAILDSTGCLLWTISALVSDICFLAKSFALCLFCWVKRSGNVAAHEAAQYAFRILCPFCLSPDTLPVGVDLACKEDVRLC